MLSVDTNVVVRLIAEDDAGQAAVVQSLLDAGPIWVSKTVLLETDWVLRSSYDAAGGEIHGAFVRLMGLPNVEIEDRQGVTEALALTLHGVQFADALHFCCRPAGTEFVSFDRTFVRRARRAGVSGVSELSSR